MVETIESRPQPPTGPDPQASGPHKEAAGNAPAEQAGLLRRSRDDRVIFGVAGGLGRYLGIDPVLVRIAFVLLAVLGGSGVLLYLVGLVVIPEERPGEAVGRPPAGVMTGQGPAMIVGVGLVAIGAVTLLTRLAPSFRGFLGPAVLVLLGLVLLLQGGRR